MSHIVYPIKHRLVPAHLGLKLGNGLDFKFDLICPRQQDLQSKEIAFLLSSSQQTKQATNNYKEVFDKRITAEATL